MAERVLIVRGIAALGNVRVHMRTKPYRPSYKPELRNLRRTACIGFVPGVFRLLATHSYAGTRQNSYAERKMKRALLISAVLLAGPAFGQEALNPVPQASTGATDQRVG